MKRFDAFLTEEETEAHKKAKAMGLEYRGFGYWADRNSGEITHRSHGDKLETVGDPLEAKAGKGQEEPGGTAAPMDLPMGGGMGGEVPMGAVLPGEEKAPRDTNWEPGPDGSTDVGKEKEEEDEVSTDVFVGKSNEQGWEAGPDGSNHTNWSFDQFQEQALMERTGMPAAKEAKMRGFVSDGHGLWFDKDGTPMARTVDGELEYLSGKERDMEQAKIVARNMRKEPGQEFTGDADARAGAQFMQKVPQGKRTNMMHDYLKDKGLAPEVVDPKFNPMAAKGKVPAWAPPEASEFEKKQKDASTGGFPNREGQIDKLKAGEAPKGAERTFADAKAALDKMSPEEREKALADLAKTKPDEYQGMNQGEYTKAMKAYKDIQKLPAKGKDLEKVKGMNEAAQQFLSDPSFDLSENNREQEIGSGAFGTVYLSEEFDTPGGRSQAIIKTGDIGRDELEALFLMKDNPAFPSLINAEFESPFKHQSTAYNNPFGRESQAADSKGRYFVPGEQSDFERKFVTARGTYAMSMAHGESVSDVLYGASEYTQQKVTDNFWDARADLHKAGIAHGDMHGGNVFVDQDESDLPVTILDLGLAQVSKLAALQEAFGGVSEEDYQLSHYVSRNNLSDEKWQQLEDNYSRVKREVMEDYRFHIAAGDLTEGDVEEFLMGGIRMSEEELGNLMVAFEFEDEDLQKYLDMMYEGFGSKPPKSKKQELEDRMAAAWEGLWDEVGERGNVSGETARAYIKNANRLVDV